MYFLPLGCLKYAFTLGLVRYHNMMIPIIVPIGNANNSITAPIIIKILPQFLPVRKAIANINDSAPAKTNTIPNNANIPPMPGTKESDNREPPIARPNAKSNKENIICMIPNTVTPTGLDMREGGDGPIFTEPQLAQYDIPYATGCPQSWQ